MHCLKQRNLKSKEFPLCWYVLENDAFQRFTELLVQVIQELQTQEGWDLNHRGLLK